MRAVPAHPPRLDEPRPPAPPPLAAWVAAAPFEGIPALLLRRFKYPAPGLAGLDPAADAVVREWILAAAARVPGTPDAILPVPLHPARLRARGFHPAGLLAAWVARAGYGPLRRGALARTRDTPSQTGLSRAARRRNVAGAFEARQALPPHVWLVDDVVTTGATLCEAARAARRAGARRVISVCALRTPR